MQLETFCKIAAARANLLMIKSAGDGKYIQQAMGAGYDRIKFYNELAKLFNINTEGMNVGQLSKAVHSVPEYAGLTNSDRIKAFADLLKNNNSGASVVADAAKAVEEAAPSAIKEVAKNVAQAANSDVVKSVTKAAPAAASSVAKAAPAAAKSVADAAKAVPWFKTTKGKAGILTSALAALGLGGGAAYMSNN